MKRGIDSRIRNLCVCLFLILSFIPLYHLLPPDIYASLRFDKRTYTTKQNDILLFSVIYPYVYSLKFVVYLNSLGTPAIGHSHLLVQRERYIEILC